MAGNRVYIYAVLSVPDSDDAATILAQGLAFLASEVQADSWGAGEYAGHPTGLEIEAYMVDESMVREVGEA